MELQLENGYDLVWKYKINLLSKRTVTAARISYLSHHSFEINVSKYERNVAK